MSRSGRRGLFVTGTDTGIGKTIVSAILVAGLRRAGLPAGYFKPVQTGADSDSDTVARLTRGQEGQAPGRATARDAALVARPVYEFPLPASPDRAAAAAGASIDLADIVAAWRTLPERHWVVEGAGGLLVPLDRGSTMRDLIAALEIPVLVVASTRLGTINHTLLTLEAARRRALPVAGLVLNGPADPGLAEVIARFDSTPPVAEIRHLAGHAADPFSPQASPPGPEDIERAAADHFPAATLRRLFA